MPRPSGLQRAFALSCNGDGLSLAIIKRRLHDEGYEADKIINPAALRQLRRILIDARRASWKLYTYGYLNRVQSSPHKQSDSLSGNMAVL
jgi:hypothetical protein